MDALIQEPAVSANPLDLLEDLVGAQDWDFDRLSETELAFQVEGRWSRYFISVLWDPRSEALFLTCALDIKVPTRKETACEGLLTQVNRELWLGHFDPGQAEEPPVFRHTIPLRGLTGPSVEQLEDLVDTAVFECEQVYPALQMIIWGGQTIGDALATVRMETAGEA